ncbi:MAG: hypothetical protein RLZZ142_1429 [Verrucomicrobiota bacterium]|jgi:hypothetical protein
MNAPSFTARTALSRRHFLRAAGAGIALPLLECMRPSFLRAAEAASLTSPRRLLAIHVPLGMMPQFFFPAPLSTDAPPSGDPLPPRSSPYLDLLSEHRGHFTSFSGLSHPGVDGNHHAGQCFLTGAPHPGQPSFRNSISLDQFAAERIGLENRFPSLSLSVRNGDHYTDSLAVSRSGVVLPSEQSPKRLYRSLFVAGTPEEKAATLRRIQAGGSVLDLVMDKAARLEKNVAPDDRARLDQYFQSVRELENRLQRSIDWENRPKPSVPYPEPKDIADVNLVLEKSKLMFDMIRLALQSDSSRVITLSLSTFSVVPHVDGVKNETHGLTHHGNEPEKVAELRKIEEAQMKTFSVFLQSLRETPETSGTLLDHTQVLYGSCLGNANSHSNQNLPIILAGGGFAHRGHLAFQGKTEGDDTPLANLFVTMLQRLGIETDKFASSRGTLAGLQA